MIAILAGDCESAALRCRPTSKDRPRCCTGSWIKYRQWTGRNQIQVERATSALADVDTTGWTSASICCPTPTGWGILLGRTARQGCVGDLAAALGRSENTVSQALRVLRQQGWVSSRRWGGPSPRLEDEIVHDLLHWIGARHG